ncbi:Aste57867_23655 [Aphanomyces stellatus]|uniref:Aste57867_23655 protein n=1 Tax=Aphanomyces stellatus TaxID=120398 RepID=A0A485LP36_9STRA|nr:hypothetical protein As57867_023583 [Aphanomyces stellatus]VFU00300.1 Aste57867_23655 [Aphanomyces stellatus]
MRDVDWWNGDSQNSTPAILGALWHFRGETTRHIMTPRESSGAAAAAVPSPSSRRSSQAMDEISFDIHAPSNSSLAYEPADLLSFALHPAAPTKAFQLLTVANLHPTETTLFSVKTLKPERYFIKPSKCILGPRERTVVRIELRQALYDEVLVHFTMDHKLVTDRLLVQSGYNANPINDMIFQNVFRFKHEMKSKEKDAAWAAAWKTLPSTQIHSKNLIMRFEAAANFHDQPTPLPTHMPRGLTSQPSSTSVFSIDPQSDVGPLATRSTTQHQRTYSIEEAPMDLPVNMQMMQAPLPKTPSRDLVRKTSSSKREKSSSSSSGLTLAVSPSTEALVFAVSARQDTSLATIQIDNLATTQRVCYTVRIESKFRCKALPQRVGWIDASSAATIQLELAMSLHKELVHQLQAGASIEPYKVRVQVMDLDAGKHETIAALPADAAVQFIKELWHNPPKRMFVQKYVVGFVLDESTIVDDDAVDNADDENAERTSDTSECASFATAFTRAPPMRPIMTPLEHLQYQRSLNQHLLPRATIEEFRPTLFDDKEQPLVEPEPTEKAIDVEEAKPVQRKTVVFVTNDNDANDDDVDAFEMDDDDDDDAELDFTNVVDTSLHHAPVAPTVQESPVVPDVKQVVTVPHAPVAQPTLVEAQSPISTPVAAIAVTAAVSSPLPTAPVVILASPADVAPVVVAVTAPVVAAVPATTSATPVTTTPVAVVAPLVPTLPPPVVESAKEEPVPGKPLVAAAFAPASPSLVIAPLQTAATGTPPSTPPPLSYLMNMIESPPPMALNPDAGTPPGSAPASPVRESTQVTWHDDDKDDDDDEYAARPNEDQEIVDDESDEFVHDDDDDYIHDINELEDVEDNIADYYAACPVEHDPPMSMGDAPVAPFGRPSLGLAPITESGESCLTTTPNATFIDHRHPTHDDSLGASNLPTVQETDFDFGRRRSSQPLSPQAHVSIDRRRSSGSSMDPPQQDVGLTDRRHSSDATQQQPSQPHDWDRRRGSSGAMPPPPSTPPPLDDDQYNRWADDDDDDDRVDSAGVMPSTPPAVADALDRRRSSGDLLSPQTQPKASGGFSSLLSFPTAHAAAPLYEDGATTHRPSAAVQAAAARVSKAPPRFSLLKAFERNVGASSAPPPAGLVTMTPQTILYHMDVGSRPDGKVTLHNHTPALVAYKIKSAQPQRYKVKPSAGVLEPLGHCVVEIALHQLAYDQLMCLSKLELDEIRDCLLVETVKVTNGRNATALRAAKSSGSAADLATMLKAAFADVDKKHVNASRLFCEFSFDDSDYQSFTSSYSNVAPPTPPSAQPQRTSALAEPKTPPSTKARSGFGFGFKRSTSNKVLRNEF